MKSTASAGTSFTRYFPRAIRYIGLALVAFVLPLGAHASCSAPANAIEAENCLPGTDYTVWDIRTGDAGDPSIQGFATSISVNVGQPVSFKVNTPASRWHLDIYRMGYYGGSGARLITTITPSVPLPQSQPACLVDKTTVLPSTPPAATTTGLVDCGNWAVSASWTVPTTATSGIYFAKATRDDTGGASHIVFIVRNDASHSDILFQASDTSWQAYNDYSANFYGCAAGVFNATCRAYKSSYNRPFHTRSFEPQTWVFGEEYPMVKWLEGNGYDVTYFTDTDTDRNGSLLLNHKLWMSNGHDEYWSASQRANVEAARSAGVNLAFFSSNSVYWKTRWENSIDGSGTPYRTLVCYKETWANAPIDPVATASTATWRDPRFSPPKDGGRPENALVGTLTRIAGGTYAAMTVPQADGLMRFWRNTSIAAQSPGQTYTLPAGTLGEELMQDEDNGFRPSGLFHLSTTSVSTPNNYLVDYGVTVNAGNMNHALTLYRHASGALVFSAATYDWSWGLDSDHDRAGYGGAPDLNMQQATVNLLADMGLQPATLQTGAPNADGFGAVSPATASADSTPPTSVIASPNSSSALSVGSPVTVTGSASDAGGGVVAAVEVSVDGGASWHPATGRASWTYAWTPTIAGSVNLQSRAVDDSGNLETPSAGVAVTVGGTSRWSLWPLMGSATALMSGMPGVQDIGPDGSAELGLSFSPDRNGYITGIRFYKSSANTGPHTGSLWTSSGTLLATATFSGESASGWQQVNFPSPVAVGANTVYVASYHAPAGHYSGDNYFFIGNGVDNAPLHAQGTTPTGTNGVYAYSTATTFPNASFAATNYGVDVVFTTTAPPPPALKSVALTPAGSTILTGATQQFTATGTYADGSTQDVSSQAAWSSSSTGVATVSTTGLVSASAPGTTTIQATLNGVSASTVLTVQSGPLSVSTSTLPGGTLNLAYGAVTLTASGGTPPYSWAITSGKLPAGLSLSPAGALSGTPTATGTSSFTVQVTDSTAPTKKTASAAFSITVLPAMVSIWSAGTTPSVVDAGPDGAVELGVKIRADTNGFIYGIRFYKASANTGVHVGNLWDANGNLLGSATFISESPSGWQQVIFANPIAIVSNTVYVASYHSTIGHYSFNSGYFATSGADNPPLHALANGVSGGDGVYAYGAASAFPSNSYNSGNYWVDVAFVPLAPSALSVTTTALAAASLSSAYSATLAASGGTTPYAWSISSGALPPGLSLGSANGVISGTPTAAGNYSFTAQVSDSSLPLARTASAALTIVVAAPALSVTTASLAGGRTGSVYSAALGASGGTAPYTWSISSGTLPGGLSLAPLTGVISGTPSTAGTFTFTVLATDSGTPTAQTASRNLSIAVTGALTVTTGTLNAAVVGTAYSARLAASGGTTPYTWSISAGSLPAGLSLSSSGTISGTPTATGTFAFTAKVVDASSTANQSATASLSLSVSAKLAVTTTSLVPAVHAVAYTATLAASGGTTPVTWTISAGSLPAGLRLTASTGVISGTPATAGRYSFTVRAADSSNPRQTATKALSLTVN